MNYKHVQQQLATNSRRCAKCKTPKTLDEFDTFTRKGHTYFRPYCRPCLNEYNRNIPKKKPTSGWHAKHAEFERKYRAQAKEKGLCGHCRCRPRLENLAVCEVCRTKDAIKAKKYNASKRQICLDHYGRKCSCPGCPIVQEEFLTIDHIGGWGKDHRTPAGYKYNGAPLYRWLIRNGFPEGFRTLCYNCNCSRVHFGNCPHELEPPRGLGVPLKSNFSITGDSKANLGMLPTEWRKRFLRSYFYKVN